MRGRAATAGNLVNRAIRAALLRPVSPRRHGAAAGNLELAAGALLEVVDALLAPRGVALPPRVHRRLEGIKHLRPHLRHTPPAAPAAHEAPTQPWR